MTPAERLARDLYADHLRVLNRLVFAAEACDTPSTPDVPNWDNSPASLECRGEETRTPEELQKIGLEWQELASKLHDLLEGQASAQDPAWADVWHEAWPWVVYLGAALVAGAIMRGCS